MAVISFVWVLVPFPTATVAEAPDSAFATLAAMSASPAASPAFNAHVPLSEASWVVTTTPTSVIIA